MKASIARVRRQLTFWYVLIFTAVMALFGVAVYRVANHHFMAGLDRSLERTVDQRTRWVLTRRAPVIVAQDSSLYERRVVVFDGEGVPFSPTEAEPWLRDFGRRVLQDSVASGTVQTEDGRNWLLYGKRFRTTSGRTWATVAVADAVELDERFPSIVAGFLASGAAAVVLMGLGAAVLARAATRPIESAFDQMRRFMGDAAHELRTPVAVLRARAEVALQRPRTGEDYEEVLAGITQEAARLGGLVENMLLLARADAGQWPVRREAVFLDDVLLEAVAAARALGQHKGVNLDVGELQECAVHADPSLLRQLIMIVLDNAVQYTPAGGTITAAATRQGRRCMLRVTDTGVGVSAAALPHVFERFFRADAARGRGGAGLGLAIARWIAEQHGGGIELTSVEGRGTTVQAWLPAA
jgi:signal transduction histidine kinase